MKPEQLTEIECPGCKAGLKDLRWHSSHCPVWKEARSAAERQLEHTKTYGVMRPLLEGRPVECPHCGVGYTYGELHLCADTQDGELKL